MKKLIIILVGSFIAVSCRHEQKQSSPTFSDSNLQTGVLSREFQGFDWSAPLRLKKQLIKDLSSKRDSTDVLITDYLEKYRKINEEFNKIMHQLPNFDSLNTLAYSEGEIYKIAKDFEKHVNDCGYLLSSSEGVIYIGENADFIKKDIINKIDPISAAYLNQYCNQVEFICCEDASLVISEKELVDRIYNWGELMNKVKGLKFAPLVERNFYGNLYLLYEGMENTPSFDVETQKYSEPLMDQMKNLIKKHPESKAAVEFLEFISLLVSEGSVKTDNVSNYIKQKTNTTSQL